MALSLRLLPGRKRRESAAFEEGIICWTNFKKRMNEIRQSAPSLRLLPGELRREIWAIEERTICGMNFNKKTKENKTTCALSPIAAWQVVERECGQRRESSIWGLFPKRKNGRRKVNSLSYCCPAQSGGNRWAIQKRQISRMYLKKRKNVKRQTTIHFDCCLADGGERVLPPKGEQYKGSF